MPEIKNQFTGGKMNKDVDERLVPKGEYRDAMNIQVSTSEGSDVGTVQNILGNSAFIGDLGISQGSVCVGVVADEKNDALYWFVREPINIYGGLGLEQSRDIIFRLKDGFIGQVFVDKKWISLAVEDLLNPASGNIIMNSVSSFNALNAGDTFQMWENGVNVSGNDVYTVLSKDFSGNLQVNIGDFSNATWASNTVQGPGQFQVMLSYEGVLKFPEKVVTGINVIDDMLFWTDGITEPKKINISRSIDGTPSINTHTRLINKSRNINYGSNVAIKEEHITVIRKAPKTKLLMSLFTGRDSNLNYSGILQVSSEFNLSDSSLWEQRGPTTYDANWPYDFSTFSTDEGDNIIKLRIDSDLDGNTTFDLDGWSVGSKVVLKPFDFNGTAVPSIPITGYVIKGTIVPWYWTNNNNVTADVNSFTSNDTWGCKVMIKVDSINGTPPVADNSGIMRYAIDLFDETEKLFEFKFPRFSYRYKYEDGEYSTFAPWTSVAFLPGSFDYHPKKGYNLGMGNNLQKLTLKNFITQDMPKDVAEIDILYKDDQSPNVHVVETFSKLLENQNNWNSNEFTIEEENIRAVLPSNQFLRPWDNVPRNAVAQEITGNRIVYGNYLQNYTLKEVFLNPIFSHYLSSNDDKARSIKSLREYQLGVVFTDEYGRETPVITNNTGVFKVEKDKAVQKNKLTGSISSQSIPLEMKYFKFYIKETSGEYYNMVMSRWYDAEDNNVWLSFPSSDRDKIDIDTFLILKKGIAQSTGGVNESARYKVLAIENEAPDFIKTNEYNIAEIVHNNTGSGIGGDVYGGTATNAPTVNSTYFHAKFDQFDNTSAAKLDEITDDLYVDFSMTDDNRVSAKYKIVEVVKNMDSQSPPQPENFVFKIDGRFGNDVNFITNDPIDGVNATEISDFTTTRFYKRVVENKPEFDGRFFVKIYFDDIIQKYIKSPLTGGEDVEYSEFMSQKIYSMSSSHKERHNNTSFGVNSAVYGGGDPDTDRTQCAIDFGGDYAQNWYYYTAYFASYEYDGSDFDILGDRVPFDDIDILEPLSTTVNTYEDVWFVDYGIYEGSYASDWDGTTNFFYNPISTDGTSTGITTGSTSGSIALSFGGINKESDKLYGESPFWDLDRSLYDHMTPFIDTLSAGYKFRWKEDPTRTVYTIYAATETKNIVNYNDDHENCTFGRIENFRKRHKFSFKPAMVWDPTEQDNVVAISNGIIINGDESGTDLTAMSTVANVSHLDISTAQYNATYDSGGGSRLETILPGLILYQINGSTTFNVDNNPVLIHSIEDTTGGKRLNFIGYKGTRVDFSISSTAHQLEFRQPAMNGLSVNSARNINHFNPSLGTLGSLTPGIGAVGYTLQFLNEEISDQLIPDDPAVWETEPKDSTDIDIYHEISNTIPLDLNGFNGHILAPVGSLVSVQLGANATTPAVQPNTTVVGWDNNVVELSAAANDCDLGQLDQIIFLRPDGNSVKVRLSGLAEPITSGPCDTSFFLRVDPDVRNNLIEVGFDWHNCYSFGNGVESNRIRDNFNQPFISNGAKVSTVLDEPYKEEYRKYGLIYSGIYNSTSGVNNLNQFIAAEKITKDINPIYGSIQKLHSGWGQGGDLIALCEDRVLKILANKDALFNADGNTNVTSTNNVLGQAIPYSGEYGISKNPESFASEAYRIYFTDKVRGTVMRLSMDGLTPISNHGMKDWFRDNLKLGDKLIGSYDDRKDEYNITIKSNTTAKTVTFREDVKGWVSFKSFTPENAISCANEYYTFKNGNIWKHHDETVDRNTFYGTDPQNYTNSSIEVIFNEVPGSVKSFKTVNYEGSQAKVTLETNDNEYFNLEDVPGWHVTNVITNLERGGITEFIKKEGKWFGYVVGDDVNVSALGNISSTSNYDTEDFSIQGVGSTASVQSSIVFGCMDTTAFNYIPAATNDDGSCIGVVMGCTDPIASNTNGNANTDDGTCIYPGCTIPLATVANEISGGGSLNFDPNANFDDGSCDMATYGCTLAGYFNSNIFADLGSSILETAGTFCGSENCMCIPINYGCTDGGTPATNYLTPNDELTDVNTDDGSCTYVGCTDPNSVDYDFTGSNPAVDGPNLNFTYLNGTAVDDGSCTYIGGCTDATACNYDVNATQDDGSCYFCGDSHAVNYDAATVDYTCVATCEYCEDVASVTITSQTTSDPGISNGTITVEFPITSLGTQYEVYIPGISSSGFFTPSGNATESYTFIGLPVGTYTIYVSTLCGGLMAGNQLPGGNFGAGPYFGTSVSATITATPVIGCIDDGSTYTGGVVNPAGGTWGACNYDATANADASGVIGGTDYSNCNYTDCVGCDDPLYIEYCGDCWDSVSFVNGPSGSGYGPWVSDTVPTSCLTLIVSGCTDATAYNYNPSATTDDGSCVPVVYGCMDTTLNNDGSYAASNYSGPTVGSANSPCDAAGTGLGTAPGECCADYNCPYNVGISISPGSTSFVFQAETFTTPYFFGPGSNITKSFTITSASLGSNTTTGFSSYNNITNQNGEITGREFLKNIAANITTGLDTSVTVDFDITTNDGNCSVSATQTFSIGCTDANADSFGSFDITDNTQCIYTGCMDPTACNYETYHNVADNASCLYCGDANAVNYDGADGNCTSGCIYTGCMDSTPQADGSGYAASNYAGPGSGASPEASVPCNPTGVPGDTNYDANQDNSCCTYNTTPGIEFSDLLGLGQYPQVHYDITNTGYTEGVMSTITIGSGGTTLTHAGVTQLGMGPGTTSRLSMTYQPDSNTTGPAYGWHPYVHNGQLDISVTNATFDGACDNPSINNQLPTGYASGSHSFSVGCRNDNTAVNYNNTLDLHLQSICEAPNPGCQDSTAITSAQAIIIGTNSRFGYSADYNQSCAGPSLGSVNAADCCCYTCNNATWQSVPVSSITFDAATSPTFATQFNLNWDPVSTASTYELTHNGSGSFASLTITPTITNGVATYTFFNTSPTRFEHGSTYTFKIKANCVNIDGNSCGSSHEETVTQEFNCSC